MIEAVDRSLASHGRVEVDLDVESRSAGRAAATA